MSFFTSRRHISRLSDPDLIALAISMKESNAYNLRTAASKLRDLPADVLDHLMTRAEQSDARRWHLLDHYRTHFGDVLPQIKGGQIRGLSNTEKPNAAKLNDSDDLYALLVDMEQSALDMYHRATSQEKDTQTRSLIGDYSARASPDLERAHRFQRQHSTEPLDTKAERQFILTWVQPGLAGLMDGSVSTLAPIFATAFATQDTWTTFLVGLAASIGAGISMGFTEAASDDGTISGRGSPMKRGLAAGVMTNVGGLGHALPYLIPDFWTATSVAILVVFIELWAIAWIQNKYMKTPFWRAALQMVVGGALVFAAGVIIGNG